MASDDEYGITIAAPLAEVDPLSIKNLSPKRYITAALGAGFEVRAAVSKTLETQPPFKSGERAGQPRPDREAEHLFILGRVPKRARFKLVFRDHRFDSGWVWDAAGWPKQLWYDYSPSALVLKQVKDEPEWAWQERTRRIQDAALRQDADYNQHDDEFAVVTSERLISSGEALDEWMADLIPDFTVRKKAVRKPKQSDMGARELLAAGEWVA